MARRERVQFLAADSRKEFSALILTGHLLRSQLFKSPISVVLDRNYRNALREIPNVRVGLISDGRKAYVRTIE